MYICSIINSNTKIMKTVKRNLLVALVLMLGTLNNYASVENKISKATKIVFENVEEGHPLKIKDDEGVVVYNENIFKSGKLIKFFDFSNLEDGDYTIEVEKEFEIAVKTVKVEEGEATIDKETATVLFRPVVVNKKDKVLISRINFDKSPLHVVIYYNDYVIVEETVSSDEKIIEKVYQLDSALKGEYKVVVSGRETASFKKFDF